MNTVLKRWRFTTDRTLTDEAYFLQCIHTERLQRLVWDVVSRIPDDARHALRRKKVAMLEDDHIISEGALGSAVMLTSTNGTGSYRLIRISPQIESDDVCTFVIAHECAHIVLGHPDVVTLQTLAFYTQEEITAFDLLAEEHASYQAYTWGFEQEADAVFAGRPPESAPRWWHALRADNTDSRSSRWTVSGDGLEPPQME